LNTRFTRARPQWRVPASRLASRVASRLVAVLLFPPVVALAAACAPSPVADSGAKSGTKPGASAGTSDGVPGEVATGPASGSASTAAPSAGSGPASSPEPVSLRFTVTDGRAEPPPTRREVARGRPVEISVISPSGHVEVHVHGYDLSAEAEPGETAVIRFVADRTGSFEVEAHPDTLLVQLVVR
jgi:hypothetical protein